MTMSTETRPLFKHIRDHDTLFCELDRYRYEAVLNLGLKDYVFNKTPKFITETGERLTIEPERSIIIPNYTLMQSIKAILCAEVSGLSLVEHSDIGYRYPTAAMAGLDAPFIKRMRSEYFHRVDEDRDICRPINLSYGIKSRGKADNRQEYEVWLPNELLEESPLPLMVNKYGEDLPDDVRAFIEQPSRIYGWMGVKRAAFEMLYRNPTKMGDLVICLAFSVDAYNIGANPDLSFSREVKSSIAVSNAELEWEVMGYFAPNGEHYSHDFVWQAIDHSLQAVSSPIESIYAPVIQPIFASKTERILNTMKAQGITDEWIKHLNLQPWEFLETSSEHRTKAHDPSRSVNLLGRLNRLFYQQERALPSIAKLHNLIAMPLD
ncbi:hypothetical protein [Glaciecola sp. 1036]|uniref:hypothetical protein n=1 Tax=Alteromonadaceae TaxID=72275 RepID=UPI003D011332